MKKVLALAAVGVFVLASCKKDYTCSCTSASNPGVSINDTYPDQKKKDAEELCDTREAQIKAAASDVTCTLK